MSQSRPQKMELELLKYPDLLKVSPKVGSLVSALLTY